MGVQSRIAICSDVKVAPPPIWDIRGLKMHSHRPISGSTGTNVYRLYISRVYFEMAALPSNGLKLSFKALTTSQCACCTAWWQGLKEFKVQGTSLILDPGRRGCCCAV